MYQEDLRDLADNLNNALLLLPSSPTAELQRVPQQRPSWAPPRQTEIYLRFLDGSGHTLTETPGMAQQLPAPDARGTRRDRNTRGR